VSNNLAYLQKRLEIFINRGLSSGKNNCRHQGLYYKTFWCRNEFCIVISYSVCHGQSLTNLSNTCGQSWSLPEWSPSWDYNSKAKVPEVPTNFRLGWEGLKVTNTLGYYAMELGQGKSTALLFANVNVLSVSTAWPHPPHLLVTR